MYLPHALQTVAPVLLNKVTGAILALFKERALAKHSRTMVTILYRANDKPIIERFVAGTTRTK